MINDNASNDWLPGVLKKLSYRIKRDIEKCLPCEIYEVHSRTLVSVRPLIMKVDLDGNRVPREIIKNIAVETIGAGDCLISFNLSVGDFGWIEASDRDISLFLQSYAESQPATRRIHSFSDAKFIPDIMTNFEVNSEDSSAVVIQNRNGSVKIALDQDEIRIKNNGVSAVMTNSTIDIENDAVTVNVTASSVTGVAPDGFDLNGTILMPGGVIMTNDLSSANSVSVGGTELFEHTHDVVDVQVGSSTITSEGPN